MKYMFSGNVRFMIIYFLSEYKLRLGKVQTKKHEKTSKCQFIANLTFLMIWGCINTIWSGNKISG